MYIEKPKIANKINGKFTVGVNTLTYLCNMKQMTPLKSLHS